MHSENDDTTAVMEIRNKKLQNCDYENSNDNAYCKAMKINCTL